MASKAIRIKRGYRSIDLAQHEAAQRLRTKGYAVDTISSSDSVYIDAAFDADS